MKRVSVLHRVRDYLEQFTLLNWPVKLLLFIVSELKNSFRLRAVLQYSASCGFLSLP